MSLCRCGHVLSSHDGRGVCAAVVSCGCGGYVFVPPANRADAETANTTDAADTEGDRS